MTHFKRQNEGSSRTRKVKKRKLPCSYISNEQLIKVLSGLTPEQKVIVEQLGFNSLLGLSCTHISMPLVVWLVQHFDTSTRCIKLDNGFIFQLDPFVIHQTLGIPISNQKIKPSYSEEAVQILKRELQFKGSVPTLRELKEALTPQLSGDSFARIFMLYVISRFLCPTGHHRASPILMGSVVNVAEIINLDWSSLTIDWMVLYLSIFKRNLARGIPCKIGGCIMALVIPYFEFLITNEFSLGDAVPRLPLWTTNIVQSYTALDSSLSSNGQFGRLPLRHVSCTPFSNNERKKKNMLLNLLPEHADTCIKAFIPSEFQSEARKNISEVYKKLCEVAVASITPVINLYASDIAHRLSSKDTTTNDCQISCMMSSDNDCLDSDCESSSCQSDDYFDSTSDANDRQLTEQQMNELLSSFRKLEVPQLKDPETSTLLEFMSILQPIPRAPGDTEPDIPEGSFTFDHITESIMKSARSRYPPPGINPVQDLDLIELSSTGMPVPSYLSCYLIGKDEKLTLPQHTIPRQTYGLSLNERFHGRRLSPAYDTRSPSSSFDRITEAIADGVDHYALSDSFWQEAVLIADSSIGNKSSVPTSTSVKTFAPCSNLITRDNLPNAVQQMVFSNKDQKDMFQLLTSNVTKQNKKSERIFKLEGMWLDKTIFCFSMRVNGWIHIHVMDAFCKMFIEDQLQRSNLGKLVPNEVIKYYLRSDVVGLLTDDDLFHSDHKSVFSEMRVGFRLENAGLVFIPCLISNQWLVIVANFIDCRFDILNPDKVMSDDTKKVINTVIHNFKGVFMQAYSRTCRFNIRTFPTTYVEVPKQKFRNDSGVFVLWFLQTYNGICLPNFSHVDIEAIREILLFQLVCFPYNEERLPIAKKFVDKYLESLLQENLKSHSKSLVESSHGGSQCGRVTSQQENI